MTVSLQRIAERYGAMFEASPATTTHTARFLSQADLWPRPGSGKRTAEITISPSQAVNMALALAIDVPVHAAGLVTAFRGLHGGGGILGNALDAMIETPPAEHADLVMTVRPCLAATIVLSVVEGATTRRTITNYGEQPQSTCLYLRIFDIGVLAAIWSASLPENKSHLSAFCR
jgi:hypothetical protein